MQTAHSSAANEALAQLLLQKQLVTASQLAHAREWHKLTTTSFAGNLVRLGLVADRDMAELVASARELPFADVVPAGMPTEQALLACRRDLCLSMNFLPLRIDGERFHVWLGEDAGVRASDWISRRLGMTMVAAQGPFIKVQEAIVAAYAQQRQSAHELLTRELRRLDQDTQGGLGTEVLINHLVQLALEERATDVHITPGEEGFLLSLRVDGVLIPIQAIPKTLARLVASIKVAASMDIGDTLRPQDGRFTHASPTQELDIRVSTAITPFGESVVLRLLPKNNFVLSLGELGILPSHLWKIRRLFDQPYGLVLLTGPTGSGKTTTLYAGLRVHSMSGKSIMTVEDPVEYRLPSAVQTQVNRRAGYDFASAIKHFLRHDPDVMLIGEIRDSETADAAFQAAETGHLVLSTLHVNSALSAPARLRSMGVDKGAIADTLVGVINQRLVRRLCALCKQEELSDRSLLPHLLQLELEGRTLYRPVGCMACSHTGYKGRLPVYEVLQMDARVAQWAANAGTRHEALPYLDTENHITLLDVCAQRMISGDLSVQEFQRVFGGFDVIAHDQVKPSAFSGQ